MTKNLVFKNLFNLKFETDYFLKQIQKKFGTLG